MSTISLLYKIDNFLKIKKTVLTKVHFYVILYISYIYIFKGKIMDIILSNMTDKPIYQQIIEQIKAHIMSGELSEGEALPSMRTLAQQLRISVITTKRAYE